MQDAPDTVEKEFLCALASTLNKQVVIYYQTTIWLVRPTVQGGFAWYYRNIDLVFNRDTFDFLSARGELAAASCEVALSASGGFPAAYAGLLRIMEYQVSAADRVRMGDTKADDLIRQQEAIRAQLLDNTMAPGPQNGGMRTVDAVSGAVSPEYQVGYAVTTPLTSIGNDLDNDQRVLTITVPLPGDGSSDGVSEVTLTYRGHTMVAASPTAWQQGTGTGWFFDDPFAQAARNGTDDVTGYRFIVDPPYRLGELEAGGQVARVTHLLISRPPVVTVVQALAHVRGSAEAGVDAVERLFELAVPGAEEFGYVRLLPKNGSRGITTTFIPGASCARATNKSSSGLLEQRAFVMGCVFAGLGG